MADSESEYHAWLKESACALIEGKGMDETELKIR